jgi:excisionase family DNA binding protein
LDFRRPEWRGYFREMDMTEQEAADLLYGVPAIAAYLRLNAPQVYHLIAKAGLPSFKIGKRVCARKWSLDSWLQQRERGGRQ